MMSRYIIFIKLKHLIFLNGGSILYQFRPCNKPKLDDCSPSALAKNGSLTFGSHLT
jgi:hypothetical protein